MPFTLAHPAAAVPLRRPLGRFGVVSALVIGSMMPDLVYFVPWLNTDASLTHSAWGLLSFCLPLGLVVYLLFHWVLKRPCLDLMPGWARARLAPLAEHGTGSASKTTPWGVPVSLWVGAATHVVWDAFTHATGFGVRMVPGLQTLLFEAWGYPVHVFKLLQHLSGLLGLALLGNWTWRWLRSARPSSSGFHGQLSERGRGALWISLLSIPALLAAGDTWRVIHHAYLVGLERWVVHFVVFDMTVAGQMLLCYAGIWQACRAWRVSLR